MARLCDHEDARFLASLVPNKTPETLDEVSRLLLLREDDARSLGWAAMLRGDEASRDMLRRPAEAGYAVAQWQFAETLQGYDSEQQAWLERAATQGEPRAMTLLALLLWVPHNRTGFHDKPRARQLRLAAALAGDWFGQWYYASCCCPRDSPEQFTWLRRCAVQKPKAIAKITIVSNLSKELQRYDEGGSGRVVFEIGWALARIPDWAEEDTDKFPERIAAGERALQLYNQWCAEASRAVWCWIWLAQHVGVSRDIRVLIANLASEQRWAWAERPPS